mmetsp:Transcript_67646/g.108953  ORF Transcript_67646/g.108953 Transcript_67646/m.108953 type:complete len:262 (-) Transcript_67646:148-933(-)
MHQAAKEGCGGGNLVRRRRQGRLWSSLRTSLRSEAQSVPREILPYSGRLVREDLDGGAEGSHDADAILPILPEWSLLEPHPSRCLLPLPARRPTGHLGLLLPHERGVAIPQGFGIRAHFAESSIPGRAHGSWRRRGHDHAASALRRLGGPRPQREELDRPDVRPRDEAREEPGADQEAARRSQGERTREGSGWPYHRSGRIPGPREGFLRGGGDDGRRPWHQPDGHQGGQWRQGVGRDLVSAGPPLFGRCFWRLFRRWLEQ